MKTENNAKGWPEGWLVAAAAAVFAAVMARVVGDLGLFATLMIAVFVFLVFGVLLGMFWGTPVATPHGAEAHGHGHAPAAKAHAGADHATELAPAAPVEPAPVLIVPEAVATDDGMPQAPAVLAEPGIAEEVAAEAIAAEDAAPMPDPDQPVLAAPEAVATDDGMAQAPVAQALLTDPVPETPEGDEVDGDEDEGDAAGGIGAPRRTKEERIAARAAKAARHAAKAARAEQAAPVMEAIPEGGRKPQALGMARGGVPDRLQAIEGIGPVLEKLCHELGIFHFDQIASWGEAEIAWMDGNLKGFKGRVTRDKWVRQAALIGEVGVDEFLRRAKSNDY